MDAVSFVELEEVYSNALKVSREERKALVAEVVRKAGIVLGDRVQRLLVFLEDPVRLGHEKSLLLEEMKQRRHLLGGKDRYGLERMLKEEFRARVDAHLIKNGPFSHSGLPCRGHGCSYRAGSVEGEDPFFFSCPVCEYRCCWRCGGESPHENCSEYADQLRQCQDAGIETHACPNCGSMTSKDGGCDRMRCEACGKQWDWTTGRTGKDLTIEHLWVSDKK